MKREFTEKEILELEKQLSCPSGEFGIKVGENMNRSNIGMTLNTIKFLELQDKNLVLELGHGNCGHLENLLNLAKEIKYFGLEISETMWKEAKKNNSKNQAEFKIYDGETIPFKSNFFDRILSVNSIYFWSNPKKLINEIERTLKPNGYCILAYANIDFMKNQPFVKQRFKLFDRNNIQKLVETSNLNITEFKSENELVNSSLVDKAERKYTMVKIKKG